MEMKFILLAVVALVGIVCEVNGEACCTPDQWQGVQASVSGFVYRHKPGRVEGVVYVFYDYANKQSAAFANYTSSSAKPRSYRIVTRYSNKTCASCSSGKLYVVDLKTDKCYTKKLDRPFRKACIPDSAKDTGSFSLGAGDASLKTRGYNLELRSQKYQLDFKLSVTEEGCIPVSELVTGVARGDCSWIHPAGIGSRVQRLFLLSQECQGLTTPLTSDLTLCTQLFFPVCFCLFASSVFLFMYCA
ncbi:hypothetical protein V1264_005604 [Littorina saxatilis]|uniref:Uncharacterized protein n=1 Tax=Littorina saxatilis TaxID=31220 RepID=A0AAN9B2F9_9CAEN